MSRILSRLNIPQLFWDVDDYCQRIEAHQHAYPQLTSSESPRSFNSRLSLSEVMTIAIAFH
ncbi:MAG: IS982 family transposase, partial [Cyanobacteria bacterium P01_F01_bin.153]